VKRCQTTYHHNRHHHMHVSTAHFTIWTGALQQPWKYKIKNSLKLKGRLKSVSYNPGLALTSFHQDLKTCLHILRACTTQHIRGFAITCCINLPLLWCCWWVAVKKTEWRGAGMVICLERCEQTCIWPSWCHCHSLSLASVKSRLVLPYWYQLTRVVPDKGPLNGCVCVCESTDWYWHWN